MIWYFDDEGAGNEFRVYSLVRVGYVLRLDPVVRTEKGAKCGHSDVRIKIYKHKQQQIIEFSSHSLSTWHYYVIRLSQGHSYPCKFTQGQPRSFKILLGVYCRV